MEQELEIEIKKIGCESNLPITKNLGIEIKNIIVNGEQVNILLIIKNNGVNLKIKPYF
jgi:hypothetical protein